MINTFYNPVNRSYPTTERQDLEFGITIRKDWSLTRYNDYHENDILKPSWIAITWLFTKKARINLVHKGKPI